MNLASALHARAARTPDAPALETDDGVWTFAALAARGRRGAKFLLEELPAGSGPVALLLPGDAGFVAWFLAAALIGRPVLPLNLRLTAGELAQQLVDSRADCLLGVAGDPRCDALAASVPGLVIARTPDTMELPEFDGRLPGESAADCSTLAVLYTSGTSGRSKGVCLSWGNFSASAEAAAERLGPSVAGRWLACMPLFHVGGLSIIARSLLFGGPVRLHPGFDAARVSDALDAADIAGLSLVPTMLSRLLRHRGGRRAPAGLEVLLLGGAAAAPALVEAACAAGFPVCPTYGLTEATSQVATSGPPQPGSGWPSPMRALRGTEVRIVTAEGPAPCGTAGEIVVRGPTVMQGYLNEPAATATALQDGWLHTRDIGYLDAEGGLHVLDRRDDLVVSGGENVSPAEVEAVLLEVPGVAEAAVAGVPDDDLGACVVAWIVAQAGAAPDRATLADHCRRHLAGFKCPREFRYVASLPRNAAGKLQRRDLAGLIAEG